MGHREITEAQARAILKILQEELGYRDYSHDGENFIGNIRTDNKDDSPGRRVCTEFRIGCPTSGGKFRNNDNRNNTPYVDCYPEGRTEDGDAKIERANKRIRDIFTE